MQRKYRIRGQRRSGGFARGCRSILLHRFQTLDAGRKLPQFALKLLDFAALCHPSPNVQAQGGAGKAASESSVMKSGERREEPAQKKITLNWS